MAWDGWTPWERQVQIWGVNGRAGFHGKCKRRLGKQWEVIGGKGWHGEAGFHCKCRCRPGSNWRFRLAGEAGIHQKNKQWFNNS